MNDPIVKQKREVSSNGSDASGSMKPPRSRGRIGVADLIEESPPARSSEELQSPERGRSLVAASSPGPTHGRRIASVERSQGSTHNSRETSRHSPRSAHSFCVEASFCVPFEIAQMVSGLDPISIHVYDSEGERIDTGVYPPMDQFPTLHTEIIARNSDLKRLIIDFFLYDEVSLDSELADVVACFNGLLPLLGTYEFALTCEFNDNEEDEETRLKTARDAILAKFLDVTSAAGFDAITRQDLHNTWCEGTDLTIIRFIGK